MIQDKNDIPKNEENLPLEPTEEKVEQKEEGNRSLLEGEFETLRSFLDADEGAESGGRTYGRIWN